jgi:hypothetical protein
MGRFAALLVVLVACGDYGSGDGMIDAPCGGGGSGIAAAYPNDEGIENDPRVIFADDFEGYASGGELDTRWDAVYNMTGITTDADHVYLGGKALEFTAPVRGSELSNGVAKVLTNELDTLFLRWYSKFDPSFDITGSSHNGGGISAHYFVNGNATPGVPADGTNKFLIEFEDWRGDTATTSPGQQNVYIYHPEQRSNYGDHFFPDGRVLPNTSIPNDFGAEFVAMPNFTPVLGRWYSYEIMLHANTPGLRDGRITCWIDGAMIADFPNLRLRDIPSLTIDRFGLSLHFGANPTALTHKWYDNVVAATAYIGPVKNPAR